MQAPSSMSCDRTPTSSGSWRSWRAGRAQPLHSRPWCSTARRRSSAASTLDPRSRFINTEIGIMIDSPEIARQVGEFIDEGIAPGGACRVTLGDDGGLVWTAETNGTKAEFDADPETSVWQRFVIDIVDLLPIEEQHRYSPTAATIHPRGERRRPPKWTLVQLTPAR